MAAPKAGGVLSWVPGFRQGRDREMTKDVSKNDRTGFKPPTLKPPPTGSDSLPNHSPESASAPKRVPLYRNTVFIFFYWSAKLIQAAD